MGWFTFGVVLLNDKHNEYGVNNGMAHPSAEDEELLLIILSAGLEVR